MLYLRRLAYLWPVVLVFLFSIKSYAAIYKAEFPNGKVVHFKFDDKIGTHRIELDTKKISELTALRVSEVAANSKSLNEADILKISGGIRLGPPHSKEIILDNVRYTLGILKAAFETPGFDRILDKPQPFDESTEQQLFVAIDVEGSDKTRDVMCKAAELANSLVESNVITRWEPQMRVIRHLNQVELSIVLPRPEPHTTTNIINDRTVDVAQLFLREFDTHLVYFRDRDTSAPHISGLSRLVRTVPEEDKTKPINWVDHITYLLTENELADVYEDLYDAFRESKREDFTLHFTIECNDSGIKFLKNTLRKLNRFLNSEHHAYILQLRQVELLSLPEPVWSESEQRVQQARVVFHLINLIPHRSTVPNSYTTMFSLSEFQILKKIHSIRDERVRVHRWSPIIIGQTSNEGVNVEHMRFLFNRLCGAFTGKK